MKILSAKQTKEADKYTIENEPISSLDLMERAVDGLYQKITQAFSDDDEFEIYCGKGNNGGDGVALARRLATAGFAVKVVIIEHTEGGSDDFKTNLERLKNTAVEVVHFQHISEWQKPNEDVVLVDAVLGSGLSRPLEGYILEVVEALNSCPNFKIAVDIPTGLFADDNSDNDLDKVFHADWTLTFQYPKLSMVHKDTAKSAGVATVIDIGLHPQFLERAQSNYYYLQKLDFEEIFKPRKKHTHKGTYGHALLIAGSRGSMGAAVMTSTAALRSGAGLLTAYIPRCGEIPLQSQVVEAMVKLDEDEEMITGLPNLKKATAVGMGPGIGTHEKTTHVLRQLLESSKLPMVFDADALNILSANETWLSLLPKNSILTPHPKEFARLLGVDKLESDYLEKLKDFSKEHGVISVLKDSITSIADTEGRLYFVDQGSPALASPGSGDVLTGIILGLLASGYEPLHAAQLGVFLQGRAGSLAGEFYSMEAALARDVLENIGLAFQELY